MENNKADLRGGVSNPSFLMNSKIQEESNTLRNSILNAGSHVHPHFAVEYYLDPENMVIEPYTVIGAGIPKAAYHGTWIKVLDAPADAIPESVVENLLRIEDRLIYDCENNFQGTEWDGNNHIGVWRDKPDYSRKYQFEIACFWDPVDWFEPVLEKLQQKWESGMNAIEIIDSEDLGDVNNGMVRRNEAIEWLEDMIQEWQEEVEEERDNE